MKLCELLGAGDILLNFSTRDKWEAIERMVDLLVQQERVPAEHRKKVHDALVAREGIASTGMEHGIAVPHASVDVLENAVAAMALSREGVNFESSDEQPSNILILLLIPRKLVQKHIRTLAGIARVLGKKETRQALLASATPEEAFAVIQREEAATKV